MATNKCGGAVATVRSELRRIKPNKDDTVESFAEKLFHWQMEIYSAHAGTDLDAAFPYDKKTREGWFETARNHPNALPKWKRNK